MQIPRVIIYMLKKRGKMREYLFFFFIPQVFDANEIAFHLRSSLSPYFESKAGGYSTCTRWGTYAPVKTKQKSKRARKVHASMVGEEVGIIGKKGKKN